MKNRKIILIVICILVALTLGVIFVLNSSVVKGSSDEEKQIDAILNIIDVFIAEEGVRGKYITDVEISNILNFTTKNELSNEAIKNIKDTIINKYINMEYDVITDEYTNMYTIKITSVRNRIILVSVSNNNYLDVAELKFKVRYVNGIWEYNKIDTMSYVIE